MRFWRILLILAALDSAAAGAWAVARPGDLFRLLQYPATADRLLICRAVGFFYLTYAPCLLLAAWHGRFAGLTLLPLSGRLLTSGVWLWLLASGRLPTAAVALTALLVHDAIWPPLLAVFLAARRSVTVAAAPAPALPASPRLPPA